MLIASGDYCISHNNQATKRLLNIGIWALKAAFEFFSEIHLSCFNLWKKLWIKSKKSENQ